MKPAVAVAICLAAALAVANAQFPFPYSKCKTPPGAYSVSQPKAMGNNTYCMTVTVTPPPGCDSYCCTTNLHKIAINANAACDVSGNVIKAWVNDGPMKIPQFDAPPSAPKDATMLKITDLGLDLESTGSEVCFQLSKNRQGQGCTTLEELCMPPAGGKSGVCELAIFDTRHACCPLAPPMAPLVPAVAAPPPAIPYPKCECDVTPGSTPFAVSSDAVVVPSRNPTKTKLYCFTTAVGTPSSPATPCGSTTSIFKAEFWAKDTLRRAVAGLAVKAAGASAYTYVPVSWGPVGDDTLKITPLNWNMAQAAGGRICIELDTSRASLGELCNTGSNTCWVNLFDVSKKCCPLYSASVRATAA